MKLKILDASVAVKWFVEEEPGSEEARRHLLAIQSDPFGYAVPELFFCEMLATFCKLLRDETRIKRYLSLLQDLGFARLGNDREVLDKAAAIAVSRGLRGYDAVYAANAALTGGVWLTADKKAHQKIADLKISKLLA